MKPVPDTALRVRPQAARTPQSIATRAKLVAIAERLFAERGIEGVSLSDINKAAGQRNKNATHYHFGSKQGLLQAILDKHVHGVSARRNQLLDEFEAQGPLGLAQVVRAFVYPVAEKLFDADGGHHFIRFQAQLVATLTLDVHQLHASALKIAPVERLTAALRAATPQLAPPLMRQRAMLATVLLFDGLADHSRMLEQAGLPSPQIDTELFIRNLEDCIIALFSAPVSPATAQRLSAVSSAGAP